MATATFTTVEARVDQQLTNAIWADEVKDNLNQLAGAHRNLLTNGGMEVWQRGAGAFTNTNLGLGARTIHTADRWDTITQIVNDSVVVTQEITTVDASAAALKAVFTKVSNSAQVDQKIEDYTQLRGRSLSFSVRVSQTVASSVRPYITDSSGTTNGATSAVTGSFVTYTVTRALGAAITSVNVGVELLLSGTTYLDNAMLVIGPAPAPYQPLHPQEDLARCQRYYEVMGGVASTIFLRGYQAAGTLAGTTIFFRTTKGGTPTVTKNGTWGVTNCGQPAVGAPSQDTCNITATVTALGDFSFTTNSSDDTITIEYNP